MGEVYRARDPKLKREVAIKVLPDQLSRPDLVGVVRDALDEARNGSVRLGDARDDALERFRLQWSPRDLPANVETHPDL